VIQSRLRSSTSPCSLVEVLSIFCQIAADRLLGLLSVIMGQLEVAPWPSAATQVTTRNWPGRALTTPTAYLQVLTAEPSYLEIGRRLSLLTESFTLSTELNMRPLRERVVALQ